MRPLLRQTAPVLLLTLLLMPGCADKSDASPDGDSGAPAGSSPIDGVYDVAAVTCEGEAVGVSVDAVVYYRVSNPTMATNNIEDYR